MLPPFGFQDMDTESGGKEKEHDTYNRQIVSTVIHK
jgi:hypothetical protein